MLNQTSFRLRSVLLPTDTIGETTQVINKVNEEGKRYYPTFSKETLVLTNDDRTVMETTKASCINGQLTFHKRGLSDDQSENVIEKRKLQWNPWTLCFVTAGSGDIIDKDDDIVRTGKQTYTWEMVSKGSATYEGQLITKGGIQFPVFESLEALKKYPNPFPWMQAILAGDGETYKYNALKNEWTMITTSTPATPALASTTAPWTVRVATSNELYSQKVDKGADNAFLLVPLSYIRSKTEKSTRNDKSQNLYFNFKSTGKQQGYSETKLFTIKNWEPLRGRAYYEWTQHVVNGNPVNEAFCMVRGTKYNLASASFSIPWQTYTITHHWRVPFEGVSLEVWMELLVNNPSVSTMQLIIYQVIY